MKAKVITTVGSKDKFNYAHDMGADYVLDHSKPYTSIIKDITNNAKLSIWFTGASLYYNKYVNMLFIFTK